MPASFSATKTESAYISDFLVMELDARYNRLQITLTNQTGAAVDLAPGEIIESTAATAGQVTDVGNLGHWVLMEKVDALAAAGTKVVSVLARGAAIINEDALTVQSAATLATVLTSLKGNMADAVFTDQAAAAVSQTGPLE